MPKPTPAQILECPNLPSLPGVAVRLLEMTRKDDVQLSDIATLVQQDQALAAKVLRTVNSSYYALASPCGSIERAIAFLGLNTVKSLVLGFSLVEAAADAAASGHFDLRAHWRRSIYGAGAARELAIRTGAADPDDAFTAGLFQDVGMLAMHVALGDDYAPVLARSASGDLRQVEVVMLGIDHCEVGRALAQRWKLPREISDAIAHHHDREISRTSAPMIRVVALGRLGADALAPRAGAANVRAFEDHACSWFGINGDARTLLEAIAEAADTLAMMFEVDVGDPPDLARVMAQAAERAFELHLESARQADQLAEQACTDALTGVPNRRRFDELLADAFRRFNDASTPFALAFVDADRFKGINDTCGHQAGDGVLVELARRLTGAAGDACTVCRYGGEEFGVVMPGVGRHQAIEIAESLRSAVGETPFDLGARAGAPDRLRVTVSVGVTATDAGDRSRVTSVDTLIREADQAVYGVKLAGRNGVQLARPGATSRAIDHSDVEGRCPLILIVDDDAMSSLLLKTMLHRRANVRTECVANGADARTRLRLESGADRPNLIVCDLNLPDCTALDILDHARATDAVRDIPFVIFTASSDPDDQARCTKASPTAFVDKLTMSADLLTWVDRLVGYAGAAA